MSERECVVCHCEYVFARGMCNECYNHWYYVNRRIPVERMLIQRADRINLQIIIDRCEAFGVTADDLLFFVEEAQARNQRSGMCQRAPGHRCMIA